MTAAALPKRWRTVMTHYWLTVHRSSSPAKARTGSQVACLVVPRLVQVEGAAMADAPLWFRGGKKMEVVEAVA